VQLSRFRRALPVFALILGAGCGGSDGGYSNPPNTPTTPGGGTGNIAVITIRADGTVDPKEIRIAMRDQVRFVNQDSRSHQPQSNPHLMHTDCPAINQIGVLAPGESRTTAAFDIERACGFHDHMNPDATGLGGTIRVAGAEGPAGPVYIKH
jgi:hypothetical protein